jgi:hypothetical protein
MRRVLLSIFAAAFVAGCQVQDPFAAFGPPRVPSPTTAQTAPYYPPTGSAAKQPPAAASAPTPRLSVSAESNPPLPTTRSRFVADSADREPIRIVENPSPTRTASAANRNPAPKNPSAPQQPTAQPPVPAKAPPSGKTTSPQSGNFRTDPAVAPATFIESSAAAGQWRSR